MTETWDTYIVGVLSFSSAMSALALDFRIFFAAAALSLRNRDKDLVSSGRSIGRSVDWFFSP